MKASLKKINVLINSLQKIEDNYFVELIFANGDSKTLRILEPGIIPNNIDDIIKENLICEIEIIKRDFTEEKLKGKNFKNSFIITNILKL